MDFDIYSVLRTKRELKKLVIRPFMQKHLQETSVIQKINVGVKIFSSSWKANKALLTGGGFRVPQELIKPHARTRLAITNN